MPRDTHGPDPQAKNPKYDRQLGPPRRVLGSVNDTKVDDPEGSRPKERHRFTGLPLQQPRNRGRQRLTQPAGMDYQTLHEGVDKTEDPHGDGSRGGGITQCETGDVESPRDAGGERGDGILDCEHPCWDGSGFASRDMGV